MNELRKQKVIETWQPASRAMPAAIVYAMLFSAMIAVQVGMVTEATAPHVAEVRTTA